MLDIFTSVFDLTLLYVVGIAFLAGVMFGYTGWGAGLVAMPLLTLLFGPVEALAIFIIGALLVIVHIAPDAARKAVAIDHRDSWAQATLARVDLLRSRHDESIARLEHAIELNPNDPYAQGQLGLTLGLAGEPDRAVAWVNEAIHLSPRDPLMPVWYGTLAITNRVA